LLDTLWTIPAALGYSMADSGADGLFVTNDLSIPKSELTYRASRAGGAGGQHVNTSSTRIEVLWDLEHSVAVGDEVRQRLLVKLGSRLNAERMVRVVASERRSQTQNRSAAEERLAALVRRALAVPKKRRPTKPSKASKERRLAEKKRRSDRKKNRRGPGDAE
jgi:ribosome-associated protein